MILTSLNRPSRPEIDDSKYGCYIWPGVSNSPEKTSLPSSVSKPVLVFATSGAVSIRSRSWILERMSGKDENRKRYSHLWWQVVVRS